MAADEFFRYTLDGDIHHITALHSTRPAIEAVLEHVGSLFVGVPMDVKVRILVDFHLVAMPPMSEWMVPIVAFFQRTGPETGHPSRVAYLYSMTSRGGILNTFLSIQRFVPQRVTPRFFSAEEKDRAIEWLHAG